VTVSDLALSRPFSVLSRPDGYSRSLPEFPDASGVAHPLNPLPTAARADCLAPSVDVLVQSRLLQLQAVAIVLSLSLSTCVLACQALALPADWFGACEGGGTSALLLAIAALGLGQLHPGAPGPLSADARRRNAATIGMLLCGTGLFAWASAWWGLMMSDPLLRIGHLHSVVHLDTGSLGDCGPLSSAFAITQGAFLCTRASGSDARAGLARCALALLLLGITLLAFSAVGLGVPFPGVEVAAEAPWTILAAMSLLSLASISECARNPGPLSILTSTGLGGRRVRRLLPIVLLPGLTLVGVALAVGSGVASLPLATASTLTVTTLAALLLLVREGHRIDRFEAGLRLISLIDELTHIYNRRGFLLLGERSFQTARRQELPLSVLYFDLDNLKPVNDAFGHATGSRLLREFAEILNQHCRSSDVVARVGGDEFAVVSTASGEALERQLQRIAAAVSERNRHGQRPYRIRYSVGRASCDPTQSPGFEELVAEADARMYEHKQARRREHAFALGVQPPDPQGLAIDSPQGDTPRR